MDLRTLVLTIFLIVRQRFAGIERVISIPLIGSPTRHGYLLIHGARIGCCSKILTLWIVFRAVPGLISPIFSWRCSCGLFVHSLCFLVREAQNAAQNDIPVIDESDSQRVHKD